jgi:aminopeptidase N
MLCDFLGEDVFTKSIRIYLKEFIYKNANTSDLWEIFDRETKMPVSKLMNKWTKTEGFP